MDDDTGNFVAQTSGTRDGYSVVTNYDCYTHLRPQ